MRYWIGRPDLRFRRGCDKDFFTAEKDFESAYGSNESYGWAYAFHAVLVGLRGDEKLGDSKKVVELIGRAHMNGLDRQMALLRVMMELSINNHGVHGGAAGFEDTLRLAWSTLQLASEETAARYFIANGLHHHLASKDPDAKSAIKRARAEMRGARARLLAMEGGLDCLEGKYGDACTKLKDLEHHFDLDALALVRRDPAWKAVRDCGCNELENQREKQEELQKAYDSYKQLFTF
jgi:hypothetical protein